MKTEGNKPNSLILIILLAIEMLFLNALLSIHSWFPFYELEKAFAPSIEFLVVLSLIAAFSLFRVKKTRLWILGITAIAAFFFLFSLAEAVTRYAFDRGFQFRIDIMYIPVLFNMMLMTELFANPAGLAALYAVIVAPAFILLYFVIRHMVKSTQLIGIKSALLLSLFVPGIILLGFTPALTPLLFSQPDEVQTAVQNAGEIKIGEEAADILGTEYSFPLLRDRNVHLFVVESYGHTIFSNPAHRELMSDFYRAMSRQLSLAGYSVASSFLESPITGGWSWLADATLLTGIKIGSQEIYDSVVAGDSSNMVKLFNSSGYRTILAAPGTTRASDEWRAYFNFDELYFQDDFGYNGPVFRFGLMPDQFSINWIRTGPMTAGNEPLFIEYVLVSSHTPFNLVPAYVEDWNEIDDGQALRKYRNQIFDNNWLTGSEYPEGYTASIQYVLKTINTFLTDYLSDEGIIVIVGDHQPRYPVREKDSTRSVVCHIVSLNRELTYSFERLGFTRGVIPNSNATHIPMEDFFRLFISGIQGEIVGE